MTSPTQSDKTVEEIVKGLVRITIEKYGSSSAAQDLAVLSHEAIAALTARDAVREAAIRIDELNSLYVEHNRHFEKDSCDIIKARIAELEAIKRKEGK